MSPPRVRAPTFKAYGRMLLMRLAYLGITDRLSEESRVELRSLSGQISALEATLADREDNPDAVRLWKAYSRELERYGQLVKASAREARMRSSFLRGEAGRTRRTSRALSQRAIHVVRELEPIRLSNLGKMVGRLVETA